jgi:hypothetical protein
MATVKKNGKGFGVTTKVNDSRAAVNSATASKPAVITTPSSASRVEGTIKRTLERDIAFSFYAPLSQRVEVAGTFNSWKSSLLKKDAQGNWKGSIKIKPGRYEYRFLVDGKWENDQKNLNVVQNQHGSYNCVLEVK